jgi:hypothetical protein
MIPTLRPRNLYAMYPPRLIPTISTTISQVFSGLSTSSGP